MEMRQLESLVAIADGGSFSRAAVMLNLAQPSLSRQIVLLEREVGQRLLVRTGRGVALSVAGEAFIVHARHILDTARQAREAMQDLDDNPAGRVVVGIGLVQAQLKPRHAGGGLDRGLGPGGHPNSPTDGHPKFPHPGDVAMTS